MKKLSFIIAVIFSISIVFTACKKDEVKPVDDNILPENFSVDIPQALMSDDNSLKSTDDAVLRGNVIYEHLRTFIRVGHRAAHIVSDIIVSIRLFDLSRPVEFSYTSGEDGRVKNVSVYENSGFEGKTWEYEMVVTDADSEGNEDGGYAMQIFWNKSPIDGVAILKPININKNTIELFENAMFRIDYTETGRNLYEKEMTVYMNGLKLPSPLLDKYGMQTLKMNVGKNGSNIEVFGNSNHPNATLFSGETGFNWAFVAAGSNVADIAVAEVGLPASDLNTTDRTVILVDNSIKNVFTNEIYATWPDIPQEQVDIYLQNTEAPGFFNHNGFVQGGTSPGSEYDTFENAIKSLTPYNPYEVTNLEIQFQTR